MSIKAKKLVALTTAFVLLTVTLLAGCGSAAPAPTATPAATESIAPATAAATATATATETAKETPTPEAPATDAPPEPITLKIVAPLGATTPNGVHDNPVINALRDKTGVTIDWINKDSISDWANYVGVMLASGDLPDAVTFQLTDDKVRGDMFAAKAIIPLDDLIAQNGPNITKNGTAMIDLMKAFKSNNGDGKTYFIGVNGGSKEQTFSFSEPYGPWFARWDIYKSIGSPTIKTDEDLLNVMKQMQTKYPTTPDGKKTYGLSGFFAETNQFGSWFPECNIDASMGWMWVNCGPMFFNNNKENYVTPIYGDNSPWLRALKLYNKANQMGLLDPECLTMKLTQYTDKCTAGRILVSQVTWAGAGSFNTNMNNEGKTDIGYAPINYPYNLGQSIPNLAYAYYPGGWQAYWVTSKCKSPERVIQLLDYTFSDEGMTLLYNGIEGKDWDNVNGVKTRKEEIIKSFQTDPDYRLKSGIGLYSNLAAFTGDTKLSDGQVADLGSSLNIVLKNLTPFQQLFDKDMGATYPAEPWLKGMKATDATYYNYISIGDNADLVEIQTKVNNYMDVQAPQLVACKTDAEFDQKWAKFKEGMNAIGYEKLYDASKAALDKARAVYTPESGFVEN